LVFGGIGRASSVNSDLVDRLPATKFLSAGWLKEFQAVLSAPDFNQVPELDRSKWVALSGYSIEPEIK